MLMTSVMILTRTTEENGFPPPACDGMLLQASLVGCSHGLAPTNAWCVCCRLPCLSLIVCTRSADLDKDTREFRVVPKQSQHEALLEVFEDERTDSCQAFGSTEPGREIWIPFGSKAEYCQSRRHGLFECTRHGPRNSKVRRASREGAVKTIFAGTIQQIQREPPRWCWPKENLSLIFRTNFSAFLCSTRKRAGKETRASQHAAYELLPLRKKKI
jgi:hypothetical protein